MVLGDVWDGRPQGLDRLKGRGRGGRHGAKVGEGWSVAYQGLWFGRGSTEKTRLLRQGKLALLTYHRELQEKRKCCHDFVQRDTASGSLSSQGWPSIYLSVYLSGLFDVQ